MRRARVLGWLVLLGGLTGPCLAGRPARAEKEAQVPLRTAMAPRPTCFFVRYAVDTVGQYRLSDGQLVRTYRIRPGDEVWGLAVSGDERRVVVSGTFSGCWCWDVKSGERLWQARDPKGGPWAFRFSGDGRYLLGAAFDTACLLDAASGRTHRTFKRQLDDAGLSPDGALVAMKGLDGDRWCLDVIETASGKRRQLAVAVEGPFAFSGDGRFVAACEEGRNLAGEPETVRVVDLRTGTHEDLTLFRRILGIAEDGAGGFLAWGQDREGDGWSLLRYDPAKRTSRKVGSYENTADGLTVRSSVSLSAMRAVGTEYNYVSTVTDLRTGKAVFTIDNSARYRRSLASSSFGGKPPDGAPPPQQPAEREGRPDPAGTEPAEGARPALPWPWLGGGAGALAAVGLCWLCLRRRPSAKC